MEQAVKNPIIRDRAKIVCEESKEITLDGDTPQRVVSADGYDLIYRIPGAYRGKALVRLPFTSHSRYPMGMVRTMYRRSAISGATWPKSSRRWPTIRRAVTKLLLRTWWVQRVCVLFGTPSGTRFVYPSSLSPSQRH